jgi:hypothetical protein
VKIIALAIATVALATAQTTPAPSAPTTREGCLAARAEESRLLADKSPGDGTAWVKAKEKALEACMPPATATVPPPPPPVATVEVMTPAVEPNKRKLRSNLFLKFTFLSFEVGASGKTDEKRK